MLCVTLFAFYLLFLPPPSLSIDAETTDDTAVYDYVVDEPSLSAKQPGKPTPLTHAYIAYSFSLMLALEIAAILIYPISDA